VDVICIVSAQIPCLRLPALVEQGRATLQGHGALQVIIVEFSRAGKFTGSFRPAVCASEGPGEKLVSSKIPRAQLDPLLKKRNRGSKVALFVVGKSKKEFFIFDAADLVDGSKTANGSIELVFQKVDSSQIIVGRRRSCGERLKQFPRLAVLT